MVNNIKDNTISEIDAKKLLNALNEIKKAEIIKYKKCTPGQKELLILFDDLFDIISTDKTLESESQEDENENEKVEHEKVVSRKEENEYKYENEDEYENEDDDEYENEDDDETMSQNKIRKLNDNLDEIIDKSKSFKDQIESLKKIRKSRRVLLYRRFW